MCYIGLCCAELCYFVWCRVVLYCVMLCGCNCGCGYGCWWLVCVSVGVFERVGVGCWLLVVGCGLWVVGL